MAALETLGEPVPGADPGAQLLEQVSHAAGTVRWLRERLRELNPADLVTDEGKPWLALYGDERDRLARWSDLAQRAGLEQRRVALSEQLGGLVVDLLRSVLDELQLTAEQHQMVATVLPAKLRALTAGLVDGGRPV